MYNHTFLTRHELENLLADKIKPLDLNIVLSAYEMSENAFLGYFTPDGAPHFFHTSRVCKILILELDIFDPDLLVAALLHDIYKVADDITPEIIQYNFGHYISFLIDILSKQSTDVPKFPKEFRITDTNSIKFPAEDYLTILLCEHLDNFRLMEFDLKFSPIAYIKEVSDNFFNLSESYENKRIAYLVNELKKERNKILG